MLALTAPRVNAASAYYYRKLGLDSTTFGRSHTALARALEGGQHRTREELTRVLEDVGVAASGLRLGYLMMRAELDAVICSGPRRGKQFTYALLDERVPAAKALGRDEALAALTRRYFSSHGPALVQDVTGWSGLTVADAKVGIEMATPHLTHAVLNGKTYWFAPSRTTARVKDPTIHLLPNYDECLIAYEDHSASFDTGLARRLARRDAVLDNHIVVLNGQVIGGWRRTLERDSVIVETRLLVPLHEAERRALRVAAERYARFLGSHVGWRLLAKRRKTTASSERTGE